MNKKPNQHLRDWLLGVLIFVLFMILLTLSGVIKAAEFQDSFEGKTDTDPVEQKLPFLNGFYHACNKWNGCTGSPGNLVTVWDANGGDIEALAREGIADGKLLMVTADSPNWHKIVDWPEVVAVSAMDEPDYRAILYHPRKIWDEYHTQLLTIRQRTDKPIFCNFAALAQNGLFNKPRHLPNHKDFVKVTGNSRVTKAHAIPELCDWVGYTPSYGSPDIGPITELKATGKKILMVLDALHQTRGWNYFHPMCSNDINCESMRANKLRMTMRMIKDNPQFIGVHTFLWGTLINEGGGGLERQWRYLQPAYAEFELFPRNRVNIRASRLLVAPPEEAAPMKKWEGEFPRSPHGFVEE